MNLSGHWTGAGVESPASGQTGTGDGMVASALTQTQTRIRISHPIKESFHQGIRRGESLMFSSGTGTVAVPLMLPHWETGTEDLGTEVNAAAASSPWPRQGTRTAEVLVTTSHHSGVGTGAAVTSLVSSRQHTGTGAAVMSSASPPPAFVTARSANW